MRRTILNLLLVSALVLSMVTPLFAQDQTPDTPDNPFPNRIYLPAVSGSGGAQASDEDEDLSPPVTVVEVDAESVGGVLRINHGTAGSPTQYEFDNVKVYTVPH